MNKNTFSTWNSRNCRCCHNHDANIHDDLLETSRTRSLTHDPRACRSSGGSELDVHQSRNYPTPDTANCSVKQSSSYGRRRCESAPDALLDCLHCGKDLAGQRSPRKRAHARRFTTVASAGRPCCSARDTASSLRSSVPLPAQRGFEDATCSKSAYCTQCTCGRRDGSAAECERGRGFYEDRCCGDDATAFTHDRCNKVPSFRFDAEDDQEHIGGVHHRGMMKTTLRQNGDCPVSDGFKCSSAKHHVAGPADDFDHEKPRRRSVEFDHTTTLGRGDYDEDTTYDYNEDDTEGGSAVNVNENRRRKSWTSFTEHRRHGHHGPSSPDKQKRRSYPGCMSKGRSSAAVRVENRQEQQQMAQCHQHPMDSGAGHGQGRSVRTTHRRQQANASEEDAEADEEEESPRSTDADAELGHRDSLLMTNLTDMWRRHRLCDVILRSNGQEIAAHKLALAAFSDTFARRYCEGNPGELLQTVVIDIPDTSAGGIQEVLRFVYTGDIRITPDNVADVLATAVFLGINDVVNMCKQMVLDPDPETVILFSSLSDKYQLSDNPAFFYDFMCKHALRVSRSRGWRTLPFSQVFDLLSEDNLNVERELDVFHAAVAWIDADRTNRLTFVADLIGCVRFAYITPEEIAKHVETKQFLFQGDEGKELLLCIYRHHALQSCGCQNGHRQHRLPRRQYTPLTSQHRACDRDQSNSNFSPPPHSQPSASKRTPSRNLPSTTTSPSCDVILSVGGVNPFRPEVELQARLVEQFHPRENRWTTLTHLPDGRHHHGVTQIAGVIYVIGGSVLDDLNPGHLCNPTASCYRYHTASGQWRPVAPLNSPRMYHATAVLNDVIFVVAGQTTSSRHLSSMECYRPEVDEWEMGVPMTEGRIGVAVAGYRGQLFAVGGFVETQSEHVVRTTVETFDPVTYKWTSLHSLATPRCHAGLAECGGKLYLVGGSTFPAESPTVCSLPSVLRYDETEDRWDRIQTLRTPRHDMGIAVLGCRIFVVGGVSSTENKVLNDVECYDVEGDYWLDDVEPINSSALGLVCLAVLANH